MVTRKMRMLAASLALVMCVSLYSVPKSKAVAVEAAAVSIGVAVLSSYLIATNMDVIADTAETISIGVTSLVDDFCEFISYSGTGEGWLAELGSNATMTSPGMVLLQGIYAREVAEFVSWLTETFGLDEDGDEAVAVPGIADYYLFNGVELPAPPSYDPVRYPYSSFCLSNSNYYFFNAYSAKPYIRDDGFVAIWSSPFYLSSWRLDSGSWTLLSSGVQNSYDIFAPFWSNTDLLYSNGAVFLESSVPVPVGDVSDQLELIRNPGFSNVAADAQDSDELKIVTGLNALTLDDFATLVPSQIATGELAPTVELTQTGEGTNPEPDTDDEAVYPYFPVLNGIRDRLDNLGDSIVDGIMSGLKSLVVPDEAFFTEAVPALQETFQGRMGLLTFPISLLADFMGRLLTLSEQDPILRWDRVSLYGTQLIAAGQYNLKDALQSSQVKQLYDIYMIVVNAILIFAFLGLCHNKYRKIMQN